MKFSKAAAVIAGLLFALGLLITCIDTVCFFKPLYSYEYKTNDTAAGLRMSDEDLMNATDTLLDYLKDTRDDIVVEATVNGIEREVFDERETLHMIDVKNLYQSALTVRNLCIGVSAFILVLLWFTARNSYARTVWRGYRSGMLCMAVLILGIVIWAALDFTNFWIQFHYLFFDNDLFFLDPAVSIMINMFPESFFTHVVFGIIILFVVLALIIDGCLKFLAKREVKPVV